MDQPRRSTFVPLGRLARCLHRKANVTSGRVVACGEPLCELQFLNIRQVDIYHIEPVRYSRSSGRTSGAERPSTTQQDYTFICSVMEPQAWVLLSCLEWFAFHSG